MAVPKLVMPEHVSLKGHPDVSEDWLQERLAENPELLGLGGELVVRDRERRQPSGGRLDLLLENVEADIRYEVEIQLGSLDEPHIIRTIEYWDIERRRYPQYEHIAVIVAEEVTGRFHNVISLLNSNRTIPLIAIQLQGLKAEGGITLVATRVVDLPPVVDEEKVEGEAVDESYWEQKASVESIKLTDQLFEMVGEIQPGVSPRYNKSYIGLGYKGMARNFVEFKLRMADAVVVEFKVEEAAELTAWLDETGLDTLNPTYKGQSYRIRVRQNDLKDNRDALVKLIGLARDADRRI